MKISDILELPDKEVIPQLKAKVVAVYEPRTPTEKQREHGIHQQSVKLAGSDGATIFASILSANMHLPESCVGDIVTLESTTDDQGRTSGVSTNVYYSERKKKEETSVNVSKWASVYFANGSKPQVEQEELPQQRQDPAKTVASKFIDRYGEVFNDAVEAVVTNAGADVILNAFGRAMKAFVKPEPAPQSQPGVVAAPPEPPAGKLYDTATCPDGKVVGQLGKAEFLPRFVHYLGADPGGELAQACLQLRADKKLSWCVVYDAFADWQDNAIDGGAAQFTRKQLDDAYDHIKEANKIEDDEAVCEEICRNQQSFVDMVKAMSGEPDLPVEEV